MDPYMCCMRLSKAFSADPCANYMSCTTVSTCCCLQLSISHWVGELWQVQQWIIQAVGHRRAAVILCGVSRIMSGRLDEMRRYWDMARILI